MHDRPVLRPWLEEGAEYRPGLKAASQAGRLASNESPTHPAWVDELAVDAFALDLHRYPDPRTIALRSALAAMHGVDAEEIVVGNGSDELIMLLIQAYAAYTGSILTASPGYSLYGLCASRLGARIQSVPLVDWRHDLTTMATIDADIAFVCNPHNPTGTIVSPESLQTFIQTSRARLIAIDEAYIDFSTDAGLDVMREAIREPRVVVLRTFSKAHALAGVRVGYLVAHRDVAQTISQLRLPFSVNSLAQVMATCALSHTEETAHRVGELVENRRRIEELLRRRGLKFVPSQGSFILILTPHSDAMVEHFASHGVSVRPGHDIGIPEAVRLTVPSEAGLLLVENALNKFPDAMGSK